MDMMSLYNVYWVTWQMFIYVINEENLLSIQQVKKIIVHPILSKEITLMYITFLEKLFYIKLVKKGLNSLMQFLLKQGADIDIYVINTENLFFMKPVKRT